MPCGTVLVDTPPRNVSHPQEAKEAVVNSSNDGERRAQRTGMAKLDHGLGHAGPQVRDSRPVRMVERDLPKMRGVRTRTRSSRVSRRFSRPCGYYCLMASVQSMCEDVRCLTALVASPELVNLWLELWSRWPFNMVAAGPLWSRDINASRPLVRISTDACDANRFLQARSSRALSVGLYHVIGTSA